MADCFKCGHELSGDEIALHKRMIGRGETAYMCINCLADFFACDKKLLFKKIEQFRNSGCLLFTKTLNGDVNE